MTGGEVLMIKLLSNSYAAKLIWSIFGILNQLPIPSCFSIWVLI